MEAPEYSWPPGALEDEVSNGWHSKASPWTPTNPIEAKEKFAPAAVVIPETVARRAVLVVATVVVDALAPLMQEHVSRGKNFDSSEMVLAETMSYCIGGLAVAVASDGWHGLWRCFHPVRYIAFLPASVAFSTSNFMTYVAVKGLGASQFYLLVQLRVALLAAFLRVWSGARQPLLAWLALLQLAVGTVVLCVYQASAGCSGFEDYDDAANASHHDASEAGIAASGSAASAPAAGLDARAEFISGIIALAGVVLSSAFGLLYLEWQLKLHAKDPIYVQLHQMNWFGALGALVIYGSHDTAAAAAGAAAAASHSAKLGVAASTAVSSAAAVLAGNASATAPLLREAALGSSPMLGLEGNTRDEDHAEASSFFPSHVRLVMIFVVVARGTLSATVLKRLDSIAKGLIDVAAIVLCTGLQFGLNEMDIDGTIVGIQVLMLLSVCSYIMSRASHPGVVSGAGRPGDLPGQALELLEMKRGRLPSKGVAGVPSKRAV